MERVDHPSREHKGSEPCGAFKPVATSLVERSLRPAKDS